MIGHIHHYVHVATKDWRGRGVIVCRCACSDTLTPAEILAARAKAGVV